MVGFFTLISLIIAWNAGGWWWLLFVILLSGWADKHKSTKTTNVTDENDAKPKYFISPPELSKLSNPTKSNNTFESHPAKNNYVIIDINTATYDSLLLLPGIGAAEARIILDKRVSGNLFESIDELEDVLQLKAHKVQRLRNLVTFSKQNKEKIENSFNESHVSNGSDKKHNTMTDNPSFTNNGRMID